MNEIAQTPARTPPGPGEHITPGAERTTRFGSRRIGRNRPAAGLPEASWIPPAARVSRGGMEGGAHRLLTVAPIALGLAGLGLLLPAVRRRPALLAACLSLAVALGYGAYYLEPDGAEAWGGDASSFYRMAEEWPWRPDGWWRYRVLVPWLVHLLPCSVNLGYFLLALVSITAAGPVLSLLLRDLGYGSTPRHAGVVLYLASFAPLYNAYNYAMPDPAAMLVLLLAARALVRGRDLEFAAWLAVGVVTKEVVLFLAPVRWLLRRGEGRDGA